MPGIDYSEMPEKHNLANKAEFEDRVEDLPASPVKITMKTASWGLKGAPTQRRDRSAGAHEVQTYAKREGMSGGLGTMGAGLGAGFGDNVPRSIPEQPPSPISLMPSLSVLPNASTWQWQGRGPIQQFQGTPAIPQTSASPIAPYSNMSSLLGRVGASLRPRKGSRRGY